MAEPGCRTICPYCGTGCGIVISEGRDGWAVGGDPTHPANQGRLCSKGAALADTLSLEGRLLQPVVDGQETDWTNAIASVAGRLQQTIAQNGADSVAFYVSGQLLTEDYYVANKLLKGFIGSRHIDTNSRLCMASTVAGHKRAFGADVVPGCYEDLEEADLVLLVGSNLAWCHPVLAQRLKTARQRHGTRVIVIDPRRTASCDEADLHLPLAAGSDIALFNGLLVHLADQGRLDSAFIEAHVSDFPATLEAARIDAPSTEAVAGRCDLTVEAVERFFDWVTETPRTVTLFSQGVNQSDHGTDKVNAILNFHLATGRIGRPGAAPFSVTGQPNAMGGREVGGLANQLAAHMDPDVPEDVERLRRFWRAPALTGGQGLKAVEMFRAVESGRIKAIWIMGTNPAVSLPEASRVRRALEACPLVIVSDVVADNDTLRHAHIRLPAAAWSEKDGTVTNSERRISRQRPFRTPPDAARADWWIITQVARALGHRRAFHYRRPAEIFREHAALSGFENGGRRAFDISDKAHLSKAGYEGMEPFFWGAQRFYVDGRFHTADTRARMVPLTAPVAGLQDGKLLLNSGRYRDQWHTMTRTGLSARLSAHRPEPLLDVNPQDAAAHGLEQDGLARITSASGMVLARVSVTSDQPAGQVFLPIHWSDSSAAEAVVSRLIPARTDPLSGQPDSKRTAVNVVPYRPAWNGVLLTRATPELSQANYWVRQRGADCQLYELAGEGGGESALIARVFAGEGLRELRYADETRGVHRCGWLRDDRLVACLFIGPQRPELQRDWLQSLLSDQPLSDADRAVLLAGRAPDATLDKGALVCACHGVGLREITAAVESGEAVTVEEIGACLSAGTGCGSCVPELKEIINARLDEQAA